MKVKIKKIVALPVMAGMMFLGMGTAVAIDMDSGMEHKTADFNKDGMVAEDEMLTYCRMHFMKMDKNSDHMIDKKEWVHDWFRDQ